jgi:hypothetical protein
MLAGKPFFDADADNSKQTMKASEGLLYFLEVSNPNTTDAYLQLFDADAADVTVGSTTPTLSFLIPGGDGTLDGAMDKFWPPGISFENAIIYACTTTATGSSDPSTGLVLNASLA